MPGGERAAIDTPPDQVRSAEVFQCIQRAAHARQRLVLRTLVRELLELGVDSCQFALETIETALGSRNVIAQRTLLLDQFLFLDVLLVHEDLERRDL